MRDKILKRRRAIIGNQKPIIKYNRVGGKIFYIDDTASGAIYKFYDENYNEITDIQVGDAPAYYSVRGEITKDKYYVMNANAVRSKRWTYQKGGAWVHKSLGTQDGIGKGKTNTALVMAADEGAYTAYDGTVWNALKALNDTSDKGCNDWFVGSKAELEALRNARDKDGNALTTLFTNTYVWSSFESNATPTSRAWYWRYGITSWDSEAKSNTYALKPIRGF